MRFEEQARPVFRVVHHPRRLWGGLAVRVVHVRFSFLLETAHDIPGPGPALHEREDEQDAHGEVLQRVGEPVRDRVDGGCRAGVHADDSSQDQREGDQEDDDDEARDAHRREVLQVADPDLAGVVERHEGQRDGAERRHDVELQGARPADHERDDVRGEHHNPADERDDEHREQGGDVVVGRDDRDRRHI